MFRPSSFRARARVPGLSAVAVAIASLAMPASAVDFVWRGGDGLWSDASMWTLLGVPGSGDTARIAFTGTGRVRLEADTLLDALYMDGGRLGGTGRLTTGVLVFSGGTLGNTPATTGRIIDVLGPSVFHGAGVLDVDYSTTLNLFGDSAWTVGQGRLGVGGAFQMGMTPYPRSQINVMAGATFVDQGAGSATGEKELRAGGIFANAGTFVREGEGTTWLGNLHNTGVVDIRSGTLVLTGNGGGGDETVLGGLTRVAAGTVLRLHSSSNADQIDITGRVDNQGLTWVTGGTVVQIAGSAQVGGAWRVSGGTTVFNGAHTLADLVLDGGWLNTRQRLQVGGLAWTEGRIGTGVSMGGGVLDVTGPASLSGSAVLDVDYSTTVNLYGETTWTAGQGRLGVGSAFQMGMTPYPRSQINVMAGATFVDQGAGSATGTKELRAGGLFVNAGTFVREGEGTTYARGLVNTGLVDLQAGQLAVTQDLSNTGEVRLATETVLLASNGVLANDGWITGDGLVRVNTAGRALTNRGTLSPGVDAVPAVLLSALAAPDEAVVSLSTGSLPGIGTLTIDGDLINTDASNILLDLGPAGQSDQLVITGSVLWDGTLTLRAAPGFTLQAGDSFLIATYGSRRAGSTFDAIVFEGLDAGTFDWQYGDTGLTLSVTAAVPEPSTYALWLCGLAGLVVCRRRWTGR
ncbi:MAG: hypothetical protein RLY78_2081 [Pseudomonadota bacterium]